MIRKALIFVLLISLSSLFMGSCNTDRFTDEKERKLRMVYTDWSEGIALTYLSRILLEDKLGYEVVLKMTDVKTAYKEMAEDKADVFADAWLPETQKRYYNRYGNEIEKMGIIYPEARIGLVVPDYSNLKSVKDLQKYDNPIIGIDSGAGVMIKTRDAIKKYAEAIDLMNLSEAEMIEHLEDSLRRRNDIVVTGWEPHWIFARYNVRFLNDPESIFGKKEKIYSLSRKGLEEKHPHAVRFFERMQLSEKQLNSLVYMMRLNDDPEIGIREWIKQNEYVVNLWVKDLSPQREKIY
ncbi:MAG: glycine betaine ABC transporter substrate-binding protein [Bacteroidales bacterium]|nr:glycine betaine ABC transporter substrate-binding protein [Bacteroidales bacterium]MCF8332950.1 glycine betaine ABC transporter substrate-binding protein [Bacteroidales bacterium]